MFEHEQFQKKLYGRRKGPKLSPHKDQLHKTLLPKLAVQIVDGADPRRYFSPPSCEEVGEPKAIRVGGGAGGDDGPPPEARCASTSPRGGGYVDDVWLEIGFGAGEHMLALARTHSRVGLIGAEPYEAGVCKLLSKIADDIPPNLRLHEGDARDILAALPDACLGKIFVLFPDPWPKTRHHKRRFIQMEMLTEFARVLKPGGEFRFASDDAGYVAWTLERVMSHPAFGWTAQGPTDWKERPPAWPETRYEAKALHGPPAYLSFLRTLG